MPANIEWIVGVVREGKEFQNFGDKYEFSGTIRVTEEGAELIGASGQIHAGTRRAIQKELDKVLVDKRLWWRRKKLDKAYSIKNV